MAQPEPKGAGKPDGHPPAKPWRQAALGGLLVALGSALFRLGGRKADKSSSKRSAPATPKARPRIAGGTSGSKKRSRETVPRPQHWPPPKGKGGARAGEGRDQQTPGPVEPRSERLGYEVKDTRAGTLAVIMVVCVTIIAASIAGLFYMIGQLRSVDVRSPPLTPQQLSVIVPPGPHLQSHPLHDIAEERQRESDLLDRYAWTNDTHQHARIPIDRAMALVEGRSLDPAAPPAPQP